MTNSPKNLLLLAALALVALTACQRPEPTPAVTSEQLREAFRDPPKAYRPMVRWWWPGGDVTAEELRREVGVLDEAHFGGGEIQPFAVGLNPKMPADVRKRVNDYRTPEFYARVKAALEEAQSRGMWLDLTFGSGWPFGGGEKITPELASMELTFSHTSLQGPKKFSGKLPRPERPPGTGAMLAELAGTGREMPAGWDERLKKREKLVAVVALRGSPTAFDKGEPDVFGRPTSLVRQPGQLDPSSAVVLTNQVSADGVLEWDVPEGDWQVFTFVQFPGDLLVVGGVGGGPQLVLDHLKLAAMQAHIETIGETAKTHLGEFFGKGLRAIFCDSLEVHAYLFWTDDFLADFKRLRGYDLTPLLPLVKVPGSGDPFGTYESLPLYDAEGVGRRVRHDYWLTVSDVMIENFYQPFADWATKNQLLSRVQAHGAPADVLRIYGLSDIPETENLYDNGRYDFLKMAPSAAHVYGREIVSSESFVWMGKDYQTTPETIKWRTDELITAGLNEIIYHGFPYQYMDRPEPGWHPFSAPLPFSSHMNEHNPFWAYLPRINDYITRLQYLSRVGKTVMPVALFRSQLNYPGSQQPVPEPEINTRLMQAGYNFDHINAHALLESSVEDGKLLSPGGSTYQQLVLLNEDTISATLAAKLAEFAKAGLPILFIGQIPSEEAGHLDYEAKTKHIRGVVGSMLGVKDLAAAEARGSAETGKVRFAATVQDGVAALSRSVTPNLRFVTRTDSVFSIQKQVGPIQIYFLRNGSAEERQFEAEFPAVAGSPEIWDPWNGGTAAREQFERTSGGVRMVLKLAPHGSTTIVFDPAVTHAPLAPKPEAHPELPPALTLGGQGETWTLRAEAPERDGKKAEPIQIDLPKLADWSQHPRLRTFSGKGHYTIRFNLAPSYLGEDLRLELDLGEVRDVAEVRVNGKEAATLLMHPYRADVTALLQPGENTLEVTVTNSLLNYMLGAGLRKETMLVPVFGKPQPIPAGLIGPVRIIPSAK